MDLIGLTKLARLTKTSRKTLLRQLRAAERDLKIKLIIQENPRAKVWVARDVLHLLRDRAHRTLVRRLERVEAKLRSHETRIGELEAQAS